MLWRGWALVAGLLLTGCFASKDAAGDEDIAADETLMDMNFPPAVCMEDTADADDCIEPADACSVSSDCPADQYCLASFDGDIGSLRCDTLCVVDLADGSWCSDDAACCNTASTCVRGLCMPGDDSTGSESSDSGSSDSGSGSSDSGSTSAESTGSGSSTSGGAT